MAPAGRNLNPNPNPNNPNPPFDTSILFGPPPNPAPTAAPMVPAAASQLSPAAAPMVPAAAGRLSPAAPYFYPSNTPPYHGAPYLHHMQYLHPSTLRPVISFPTPNPTANPNLSANPSAALESLYIDYPHDLQSPMPQSINSLLMPNSSANVNLSANPGAALRGRDLYYPQDLRHLMPHSVNSFPMQYPNANLNLSFNIRAAVARLQDHQSPMPRSVNSLQAPNPDTNFNLSANTSAASRGRSFQYAQDIRHSMPSPVISSDMPNQRANPGAASAEPKHNEGAPNGRQNNSADVIEVYDSDSDDFVEEATPTYSKSNGKASSDSLKTGGKASSSSKGEASKGGKAFSAGKGGKGSTSNAKPPQSDAELKLQLDLPPNSKLLMNCEAAEMLQQIHEHMAILSEDPKIKIPEAFDKAFQYAKEGNHFSAAKSVKQILEPLKNSGVTDGEICMIANIGPETIEEVYALIPSLKATRAMNEGKIVEALTALANIKASK